VPVEISGEYLYAQAKELRAEFPALSIEPVVADFTMPFALPEHPVVPRRNLVFFPGSTIGNFQPDEAHTLLETMRLEAGTGGTLLIGVDLIKDIDIVLPAYNDSQGITAAFNLNVLNHLNNAIGADFDSDNFQHEAIYDRERDRIEMRLIAVRPHDVKLDGETLSFAAREHIVTEHSHKYTISSFRQLAQQAGWRWVTCWTDASQLFSVHFLTVP
jgi:dimethylhistidine N-methyltransferase